MMSFRIELTEKDRAASRFMGRTFRALQKAAALQKHATGLSQAVAAERMGVNRSFLSRILKGTSNPTLRTLGETAWALGLKPEVTFTPIDYRNHPSNWPAPATGANYRTGTLPAAYRHEFPRAAG